MTAPAPSRNASLDDRYGRTRRPVRRRVAWAAGGLAALALVGYVAWNTVSTAVDTVDTDTTGFRVVDEHSVVIDFQVTLRSDTAFACALEAQDVEHGVVGWRVVEYGPDAAHTRSFSETVPTTAEATTGLATSCWIP
jgi:hypothetical protein